MSKVTLKDWPNVPVYGADKRPPQTASTDDLQNSSVNFVSYIPNEGDKVIFASWEETAPKILKQEVRAGSKAYIYLMPCYYVRKGTETQEPNWFNINALNKRDINMVPVNPTWYNLGNNLERAKGLCEMGEITRGTDRVIKVGEFDNVTKRNKIVPTIDPETGKQKIDEDGTAEMHVFTKDQSCAVFTPYVPAK